jgi:sensor domain CHASE-containing protein
MPSATLREREIDLANGSRVYVARVSVPVIDKQGTRYDIGVSDEVDWVEIHPAR